MSSTLTAEQEIALTEFLDKATPLNYEPESDTFDQDAIARTACGIGMREVLQNPSKYFPPQTLSEEAISDFIQLMDVPLKGDMLYTEQDVIKAVMHFAAPAAPLGAEQRNWETKLADIVKKYDKMYLEADNTYKGVLADIVDDLDTLASLTAPASIVKDKNDDNT